MSERQRPSAPERTTPGGPVLPDLFDADAPSGDLVVVQHGIFTERVPAGRSVGDIRRSHADRLDIPPGAQARIGGQDVGDDAIVQAGERLEFSHEAGEKGAEPFVQPGLFTEHRRRRAAGEPEHGAVSVTLDGGDVRVTTEEGTEGRLSLDAVLAELPREGPDTAGILPEGTVGVFGLPRGGQVVVHQTPPTVRRLRWVARDSEERWGPGTKYREVRVALPYLVLLAVFGRKGPRGQPVLTDRNEVFFRTAPLRSLDDPLSYPALLNVSYYGDRGPSLAWVCTQHLQRPRERPDEPADHHRARSVQELWRHLLDGGFNESSEAHEAGSWFTESVKRGVDPRIETIEAWEQASAENPEFPLEVSWVPTGHSLAQVVERIRRLHFGPRPLTAHDVARTVLNAKRTPKTTKEPS